MRKYHYEYFAYTDNLCYGHMLIGQFSSMGIAEFYANLANKGCYVIEKHRVYD